MSKIEHWIVEVVDSETGEVRRSNPFELYEDALDVYSDLKASDSKGFISIQKVERKLLLED